MTTARFLVRHGDGRAIRTFAALRRWGKVRLVLDEPGRFVVYHAPLAPEELAALEDYVAGRRSLASLQRSTTTEGRRRAHQT